jgi:S-adenosylmethionine-dependent methyltransferase
MEVGRRPLGPPPAGNRPAGDTSAGSRPVTGADLRQSTIWQGLQGVLDRPGLTVVDAGGGSGGFAVPLAEQGHRVVVVDPSPDALAALARRARERGVSARVEGRQGDLAGLVEAVGPDIADVLLCHAVLDLVDDPERALAAAMRVLRPGGALSVVVANRVAVVLARALAGRFEEAERVLTDPAGRCDRHGAPHRFDTAEAVRMVHAVGGEAVEVHGVRVFADLVPAPLVDADPFAAGRLASLEAVAATRPPFRDLATQLHVLARRPAGGGSS